MKMKSIFPLLLAVVMFYACSNDPGEQPGGGNQTEGKAVYFKISTSDVGGGTRADEPSMEGQSAPLYSALIYFLDNSTDPEIYAIRTAGAGMANVTLAQLEDGVLFEGIPSDVTQVYVVGNYNSSDELNTSPTFPMVEGQTLSEIQDVVWNIQQVSHGSLRNGATYGQLLTVMDGLAEVQEYDTNPGGWNGEDDLTAGDLYADVVISPIVSRIEIDAITYTGSFNSFTLEGIYINYYYPEMPLSLNRAGFAFTNNGSNEDAYTQSSPDFAYERYSTLYDIINETVPNEARALDETFTPENGTWAYQVFGNSSPVPHIIIKLINVVDGNSNYLGNRYVTVGGYLNGTTEVTTFARNTIYRIENLAFTDEDISIVPEPETINLWVHVSVAPWITVNVTPII